MRVPEGGGSYREEGSVAPSSVLGPRWWSQQKRQDGGVDGGAETVSGFGEEVINGNYLPFILRKYLMVNNKMVPV